MEPLTAPELTKFAPRAKPEYIEALVHGWPEMQRAGLTTPLRLCEFLAQIAHETGGFVVICENLKGYTAKRICEVWPSRFKGAQGYALAVTCAGNEQRLGEVVYGGRLGNINKGDGYLYRGRGFLQDTGRDCYDEYGHIIGEDLETHPELLQTPSISLLVALARWQKLDLNRFADRHYSRAIGNAINRGNPYSRFEPIGYASRTQWFKRAWALFGDGNEAPTPLPGMGLGAQGSEVELLQAKLVELGYQIGSPDTVFGPVTARAVAAFKLDFKRTSGETLEPDEEVGPQTWAALNRGAPIEHSEERTEATAKDLIAAGSQEAAGAKQQMSAGTGVTVVAAGGIAQQTGMLDAAQNSVGVLPKWMGVLDPAIGVAKWAYVNLFFVALLLVGIWVYAGGHKTLWARLKAHRSGANLSR